MLDTNQYIWVAFQAIGLLLSARLTYMAKILFFIFQEVLEEAVIE